MIESQNLVFNRFAKVEFIYNDNKVIFTSEDIDFNAKITLDMTNNSNKADINIYNLPLKVENLLSSAIPNIVTVRIYSGYDIKTKTEYGLVFTGILENIDTKKDNNTINSHFYCSEINPIYKNKLFQVSVKNPTKASVIIEKIMEKANTLEPKLSLIKPLELKDDCIYERSKSFNGDLKNILTRLAKDTKSIFILDNQTIQFIEYKSEKMPKINCDPAKILNITNSDIGYTITMLFEHQMKIGHNLLIKMDGTRFIKNIDSSNDPHIISKIEHFINPKKDAHVTKVYVEVYSKIITKDETLKQEKLEKEKLEKNKIIIFF
ncbi:hypothetical protein [Sebaldella sp. S0638]|uniref:hypothetical protein n=1 Tax=Sebaldella sp. S0638 TaxID=2957809 RepID=UPI00209D604E|nr:hypothetical protein [Sebaldella sp. S0638]MCP1226721.1 hypothetical protein [Sebaldella sp. S0638]